MDLLIVSGEDAGKRVRPEGERFVIGRVKGCDLVVRDAKVSREHAYVRTLPDGRLELADLGSANGTWVDGRQIERVVLEGGEKLRFGNTVVEVANELTAARPAPSRPSSNSAIQRILVQAETRATRALVLGGAAAGVAAVVVVLFVAGVFSGEDESDPTDAVRRATPSTVLIEAIEAGGRSGTGSGWVLDADDALIVTNAHVVNDGVEFRVGFAGRLRPAEVVAVAPCEDLALLRVRGAAGLRPLRLGDQDRLALGATVVALGFAENASAGDDLTSTTGSVSVARTTFREPAPDFPSLPNVIQTDTALNPGNSGGPLVDLDGRLVGVNSAARTVGSGGRIIQGQNYAIGVDRVKELLADLRRGRSLAWAGLGFGYPSAEELAARDLPNGLFVPRAVKGSPAEAAGIAEGSPLLVGVNDRAVGNTLASYCDAVRGIESGEEATLLLVDADGRSRRARIRFG